MAATTTSVVRNRQEPGRNIQPVAASTKILAGVITHYNSSKYIVEGTDTAGEVFAGVSIEEIDNSDGANGDYSVTLYENGDFEFTLSEGDAVQADIGTEVYTVDNQTVARAATTTNDIAVGYIVGIISATIVRVRISVFGA